MDASWRRRVQREESWERNNSNKCLFLPACVATLMMTMMTLIMTMMVTMEMTMHGGDDDDSDGRTQQKCWCRSVCTNRPRECDTSNQIDQII